jgi:hypothetical protein
VRLHGRCRSPQAPFCIHHFPLHLYNNCACLRLIGPVLSTPLPDQFSAYKRDVGQVQLA